MYVYHRVLALWFYVACYAIHPLYQWCIHVHSKNSRLRIDPDLGPIMFDPESVSIWPWICVIVTRNFVKSGDFDSDFGTHWHRFRVKLTQKWIWLPGTKIRVNSDPGVFRVCVPTPPYIHSLDLELSRLDFLSQCHRVKTQVFVSSPLFYKGP